MQPEPHTGTPTHGALVLAEEAYINQISTSMNVIPNDDAWSERKRFYLREVARRCFCVGRPKRPLCKCH